MASRETSWVLKKQDLLRKTIANCAEILCLKKGQLALVDMREYKAMWTKSVLILKTAQVGTSRVGRKSFLLPNEVGDEGEIE